MPAPVSAVVRATTAPGQRWLARILLPLITLAGAAIVWAAWGLAPWHVYVVGVAVAAFGVWLQVLVEMSGRETLTVDGDGSIRIHSPGLLAREVRVDRQDVISVSYAGPELNQPRGETLLNLLGGGGYIRIELREPRVLPAVRWTNYLWCLRAQSDSNYIAPPLPRTQTAVLDFRAAPDAADAALRLLTT